MNKKERVLKEIGKVLVSLSHLVFASLLFGSILKSNYDILSMLISSACIGLLFLVGGIICLTTGGDE
jgi:hypothetical protein